MVFENGFFQVFPVVLRYALITDKVKVYVGIGMVNAYGAHHHARGQDEIFVKTCCNLNGVVFNSVSIHFNL